MHTTHTSKSHSRIGSHVSQEQHNKAMQLEIDQLKRKLCHVRQEQTPSNSDVSSKGAEDTSYRQRSRTPPSKSFSYEVEHQHKRRYKSPTHRGLGNDVISKALTRFPSCPSLARLKGQYFLGGSVSQHSPSTMVERTLWSL